MSNHPSSPSRGFRLGPEPPSEEEALLQEENVLKPRIGHHDIKRLYRRVNVFTLLLPILLIILVLLGYLDIKRRVSQTQDSGTIDVLNLSKDLESSFSSLSIKQAKLAEALQKQTTTSQQARTKLQTKLEKTRQIVKQLSAAVSAQKKQLAGLKAVKKELRREAQKLDTLVAGVNSLQKSALDKMTALEDRFSQTQRKTSDLAAVVEKNSRDATGVRQKSSKMHRDLEILQANLKRITATGLNREMLTAELKVEALRYQKQLQAVAARLDKKITTLQRQISLLSTFGVPKKASPRSKTGATPRLPKKFLEQDIKQ